MTYPGLVWKYATSIALAIYDMPILIKKIMKMIIIKNNNKVITMNDCIETIIPYKKHKSHDTLTRFILALARFSFTFGLIMIFLHCSWSIVL